MTKTLHSNYNCNRSPELVILPVHKLNYDYTHQLHAVNNYNKVSGLLCFPVMQYWHLSLASERTGTPDVQRQCTARRQTHLAAKQYPRSCR